jgi:hypothetical protein
VISVLRPLTSAPDEPTQILAALTSTAIQHGRKMNLQKRLVLNERLMYDISMLRTV